jgi:hypothetical protein
MKVRKGFVSNSSSSSFIVKIPSEIDTAEKLKETIFGDREVVSNDYAYGDNEYDTFEVSKYLFDIMENEKNNIVSIMYRLEPCIYMENPYEYGSKEYSIISNKKTNINHEIGYYRALNIIEEAKQMKCDVYHFEFDDHGGIEGYLETGEAFEKFYVDKERW